MNRKWLFWRWLALLSILSGIVLAMFQPSLYRCSNPSDFEWRAILLRFFTLTPLCFIAFGLLVLIFQHAINLFRGIFSWRGLKCLGLFLAALTILTALFYAEEDWRGWRAWQNCKHELEAVGEHLDFAHFIPPPVPDDQNFALTPIVASCYGQFLDRDGHVLKPSDTNLVNRLVMTAYRYDYNGTTNQRPNAWQRGEFTDLQAWQDYYRTTAITNSYLTFAETGHGYVTNLQIQLLGPSAFPIAPEPLSSAAAVLLALSKYDGAIEELRQASRLACTRFPLDYSTRPAYDILLPHLQTIRNCAQVLSLRSVGELADGQTEKAFADVRLILYLANSIQDEPFDSSQSTRVSTLYFALQPIWEGLAKHQWTDTQLCALDSDLSRFDFLSSYQLTVRARRTLAVDLISEIAQKQNLREFCDELRNDESDGLLNWPNFIQAAFVYLMPRGWLDQNRTAVARIFQQSLMSDEAIKQQIVSPGAVHRANEIVMDEFRRRSFYEIFISALFPPLVRYAEQIAHAQASANLARAACALERYQLAYGKYPETLDALEPDFMEKVPHDIINGQPLHYRREINGHFVLYSIGWNERDDGGHIVLSSGGSMVRDQGDWVWQYPAK